MDGEEAGKPPCSSFRAAKPPIIHDEIFKTSANRESASGLVKWIVKAATLIDCPAGFHFPAVRAKIPTAWIDANSAMDGLKTAGTGNRYVTWSKAVETFECFMKAKGTPVPDPEGILLRAMRHREAEGGVLLSVQGDHDRAGGSTGMLYLDPTWLIDLVRRLTDHNLVKAANQATIKRELEEYGQQQNPRLDLQMLWAQHRQDMAYITFNHKSYPGSVYPIKILFLLPAFRFTTFLVFL